MFVTDFLIPLCLAILEVLKRQNILHLLAFKHLLQSFQAVRKMEQLQASNILDVSFFPNLVLRYLMLVKL